LAPCGRCRQLLFEHGGPEALLMTDDGPQKMSAMLPWAFGPDDLDRNER
jgi:cytidine deaminase